MADAFGHSAEPTPAENIAAVEQFGGIEDARLEVRHIGLCVECGQLVERQPDGSCPAGHDPRLISGSLLLYDDEPLPVLPRFNLAAFFLPIIWGPAHGQWAGAFFLPIWLFADSSIAAAAERGGWLWIVAAAVMAGTLGFGAFFARKGNAVAYRRVMGRMTVQEYTRRERIWAWICVPAGIALISWGLYFDLVLRNRL